MTEQGCLWSDKGEPMTQFPEPYPAISGFLGMGNYPGAYWNHSAPAGQPPFLFSIIDEVEVPADLETGSYMLSFRWDCEQSPQVWNGCTDIEIVDNGTKPVDILRLDQTLGMQSPGRFYVPEQKAALAEEETDPCNGDDCSSEDAVLLSLRRTLSAQNYTPVTRTLPTKDAKGNLFGCQHLRCMCAGPCNNQWIPLPGLCEKGCGDWIDCSFEGCSCSEKCDNAKKCSPSCTRSDADEYLKGLPFADGVPPVPDR